ncbi:hypothetical protein ACHAWF_010558 [Thalassiosira exigua]
MEPPPPLLSSLGGDGGLVEEDGVRRRRFFFGEPQHQQQQQQQQHQQPQQQLPQHQLQLQHQHQSHRIDRTMLAQSDPEADLRRRVARRLLTDRTPARGAPRGGPRGDPRWDSDAGGAFPPQSAPPWRVPAGRSGAVGGAGAAARSVLPAARGPPPAAAVDGFALDFNGAGGDFAAPPPPPPWEAAASSFARDGFLASAASDLAGEDFEGEEDLVEGEGRDDEGGGRPPPRPKTVTFGIRDSVHRWDERADVLKRADDEFFAAARFLLDVVGTSENWEEYLDDDDEAAGRAAAAGIGGSGSPGGGLLARVFGCAVAGGDAASTSGSGTGPSQRGGDGREGRYRLTEKLVRDFLSAVKFRMEGIEERRRLRRLEVVDGGRDKEDEEEDEEEEEEEEGEQADYEEDLVARKTRKIARTIDAYGLPLMPGARVDVGGPRRGEGGRDRFGGEESPPPLLGSAVANLPSGDGAGEGEEEGTFLDTFGRQTPRERFFPVLPVNDDEDDEDNKDIENDENDFSIVNQLRARSRGTKDAPAKPTSDTPTPSSFLSSLLSLEEPPPSIPGEEDCRRRLAQIRYEIEKSERMIDDTCNEAVRSACRERAAKLRNERRFYQIVQERHRVRAMMEATRVEAVRAACRDRLHRLVAELEALQLEGEGNDKEEEDDAPLAEVGEMECEPMSSMVGALSDSAPGAEAASTGDGDGEWYDRVLRYLNGRAPLTDGVTNRKSPAWDAPSTAHDAVEPRKVTGGNSLTCGDNSSATMAAFNSTSLGRSALDPKTVVDGGNSSAAKTMLPFQCAPASRDVLDQIEEEPLVQVREQSVRPTGKQPKRDQQGTGRVRFSDAPTDSTRRVVTDGPRGILTPKGGSMHGQNVNDPPYARRPVANAVKSRTPWFEF